VVLSIPRERMLRSYNNLGLNSRESANLINGDIAYFEGF
jgi:hypothetical protein